MAKLDLLNTLIRRRVPVARWLVDEQLMTLEDYENWKASHSDDYSFSEDMDVLVEASITNVSHESLPDLPNALKLMDEPEEDESCLEETDSEAPKSKKSKKKAVHTDESGE